MIDIRNTQCITIRHEGNKWYVFSTFWNEFILKLNTFILKDNYLQWVYHKQLKIFCGQILCHSQWFCEIVSRWILSLIEYLRIRKESIFVRIIGKWLSIWYARSHCCPTNFFHVKFVWKHIALSEVVIEKKSLKSLLKYYKKLILTGNVLYEGIWRKLVW